MKKILIFLAAVFSFDATAFALNFVNADIKAGLGYSDNVYQDDLNKKSDTYSWLGFSLKYKLEDASLAGRAQVYLYNKESDNNNLTYSLKYKPEEQFLKSDVTLSFGGYNYFKSDVGSTEESYNNIYFLVYLTNKFYEKPKFNSYFEPGLKFTSYSQLSGRYDFNPYARINADWELKDNLLIMPYFELGLIYSNQSYFTRSNIDFGATAEFTLPDDILFSADVFLRRTVYPNRKVSDIISLPRRQGRTTTQSIEVSERTNLAQFTLEIMKQMPTYEYGANVSRSSLNSLSELEYYNENQINVFARILFD